MNINKNVIDKLVKENEKIAELFSNLNSLKEIELQNILDEISKLKKEKIETKKPKSPEKIDIEKSLLGSFSLVSKLLKKPKIEKPKPITIIKSLIRPVKKIESNQSSQNFERAIDTNEIQIEKLKTMKSILGHLDFKKVDQKKESKKIESNLFDKISNGLIGAGIGGVLGKGRKLIKKVGVGKTLSIAYALKSGYDLFAGIKQGYSDYKRFKKLGDNVSAENVLFKTFIGSFGNLFNIVGSFVPGPIGVLLLSLGGFLDYTAGEFDSILADKGNKTIQDQQKSKRVLDLIKQGEKNNILQLRPTTKNWEYKDYSTDSWEILRDSKGKPITTWTDRIQTVDKSPDGVQRYKLKTEGKMLDLVLIDGKPKIKTEKGYEEITPRKDGGKVNAGQKYLVGEVGKEKFVREDSESSAISEIFNKMNKNFKKMVDDFSVKNLLSMFTIQSTTYSHVKAKSFDMTGKEMIDFNKVSSDSNDRFKDFLKQLFAFEGGYADVKGDKGGKTKFGITQDTYNAYLKNKELPKANVADITKEIAEKIYYEEYYLKSKANEISDPKLAYLVFDTYVMSPSKAKQLLEKYGDDVQSFIQSRKEFHLERSTGKDQAQFKDGWMNRIKTLENMINKSIHQAELDSMNTKPVTQIHNNKDLVDSNFLINNIVPLMADAVSEIYGS